MNLWEGIDDRPPKLRTFTPEEEKQILEESARRRAQKAAERQGKPLPKEKWKVV